MSRLTCCFAFPNLRASVVFCVFSFSGIFRRERWRFVFFPCLRRRVHLHVQTSLGASGALDQRTGDQMGGSSFSLLPSDVPFAFFGGRFPLKLSQPKKGCPFFSMEIHWAFEFFAGAFWDGVRLGNQ